MVYDSGLHAIVMFGGNDSNGNLFGDTWEWDGSNWTQLHPATSPSARTIFAMAHDSDRAVTVLFNGVGGSTDTWELGTAPASTLSINRTKGSFNDAITITGTGFKPNELVNVYDDVSTSLPVYAAITDSTGSFVINRHVVAQPYGSHMLIAVGQTSQIQASTTFFMQASLRLRPTEGIPDQTIGVTGHGYGANETVRLRWDSPAGPTLRQDGTNSRGTLYTFFTVPRSALPGQHLVYATGTQTRARVIDIFTVP
jgi:hypothetical protein